MAKLFGAPARAHSLATKVAAVAGLATVVALGVAPLASASGTSGKTNGCYSTWGTTGTNGHCYPVTADGNFRVSADCNLEPDGSSGWSYFYKNANIGGFGQYDCTFKINSSWVEYSGG
ncbi:MULTISPECIES: hypothetical protein [unclassified Kitasatospora]|uniref:hypothetical protein n=1 Tax=unclassified Kitasatospora TaxID=2633591 RepID=UPI0006717211|nr:hypothetical protein [Kitasatospora sp. MY 5-36]